MIVLHRHDTNDDELFAETATASTTPASSSRPASDLEAWQAHLEAQGVVRADTADKPLTQSPIADEPYGSVLVFRDPDNIQLELFSPRPPDRCRESEMVTLPRARRANGVVMGAAADPQGDVGDRRRSSARRRPRSSAGSERRRFCAPVRSGSGWPRSAWP